MWLSSLQFLIKLLQLKISCGKKQNEPNVFTAMINCDFQPQNRICFWSGSWANCNRFLSLRNMPLYANEMHINSSEKLLKQGFQMTRSEIKFHFESCALNLYVQLSAILACWWTSLISCLRTLCAMIPLRINSNKQKNCLRSKGGEKSFYDSFFYVPFMVQEKLP